MLRYARVVRQRPGESGATRQQRIYDFENDRSFADYIGDLPEDAAALFRTTVTRSAGDMDEISAGAGIGYFSLVWNIGQGLNRGIVGGPSTLTEAIAAALGDRVQLGAEVQEIVHRADSVVVRYRQDGVDHEVRGPLRRAGHPGHGRAPGRASTCPPTSATRSARSCTDRTCPPRSSPTRRRARPWDDSLRHRLPEAVVRHRAEPGQHRPRRRDRSGSRAAAS